MTTVEHVSGSPAEVCSALAEMPELNQRAAIKATIGRIARLPAVDRDAWRVAFTREYKLTTAALFDAAIREARTAGTSARGGDRESSATGDGQEQDGKKEKTSTARRLVDLAHELYELGCTTEGRPFVAARTGPRVARWLRGGSPSVIGELSAVLHERTGTVPTGNARGDALALLTAQAEARERVELTQRVARHGDALVLDLADSAGRAVVIGPDGWQVVDRSPVLFTRSMQTLPLPVPVRGGSLESLWPLVNVAQASRDLYVAVVLSYLFQHMDHPILDLSGEAGAGKSTTARNTARLIDPSAAPLARMPTHEKDLDVVASQSYVLALDNLSRIEEWQSDALCSFVTGVSAVRRGLYTDSDLSLLKVRLCVILTAIDYGTPKADLAQRLLPIRLSRLPDGARRNEEQIGRAFSAAHPGVLGALLDLASKVLAHLPAVDAAVEAGTVTLPRLAGFGGILAALDRADGGSRLDGYHEMLSGAAAEIAQDDEVATAIRVFARKHITWTGTSTELHAELTRGDGSSGWRSKFWPETVPAFGKRVSQVIAPLREVGVRVERVFEGTGKRRRQVFEVSIIEEPPEEPPPGDGPPPPDEPPPLSPPPISPDARLTVDDYEMPCAKCGNPTVMRVDGRPEHGGDCVSWYAGGTSASTAAPTTGSTSASTAAPTTGSTSASTADATRRRPSAASDRRKQAQQDVLTTTLAAVDAGTSPRILAAFETAYTPIRKDENGLRRKLFLQPELPGMTYAAHVPTGYMWSRPYVGDVVTLDRSGAWISSASSVNVSHGQLQHTGEIEYQGAPGYYLIQVYPWYEGEQMPHPLNDPRQSQIWVTQPTIGLLSDLVDEGRWPDITVLDSYTGLPVRLTEWTTYVSKVREYTITTYGRGEKYVSVKESFSQAMSMMLGKVGDDRQRVWKCKTRRPDIRHTVESQTSASMWRWADDCRKVTPEHAPVALRNLDELVIPAEALEIVTTTNRSGGRKPLQIDPDGIKLGTFKVKSTEAWGSGSK